jgi:SpoIIAA-like
MLSPIADMPPGTLGFEARGEVDDDDWEETVEPILRQESAAGRKVRLLYLIGPQAGEVEGDAVEAGTEFRARHLDLFERVAVVSDEGWTRPALRVLSVLLPGKVRGFAVSDLAEAKRWVAEPDGS